jgi:glycerate dehydrogenase
MNVLVYTRTIKQDNTVKFVGFDELLENSDIVSAHCPLTDKNVKMFNSDAFSKMKKSALFINTARGGLVDEEALFNALSNGDIAAAALDVLTVEPMSKDCILKNAPNLIITPHTAWAPLSTRKRLLDIVFDNLFSFKNGNPKNVVNK